MSVVCRSLTRKHGDSPEGFQLTSDLLDSVGGAAALVASHCDKMIQCDRMEATQARKVPFRSFRPPGGRA